MKINKSIKVVALLSLLILGCNSTKDKVVAEKTNTTSKIITPEKPNILFVICDDLGYADVGFNGSKDIITPNLDALASKGTKFASAYVPHPFCGPSRAGIMTGRYAHKIGAQFNLPPNSETIAQGIDVNEPFFTHALQKAGYYTGLVGKWHLGAVDKFHPNNRGFDDFYGFLGGGHNYFPNDYKAKYKDAKERGQNVIWEYILPLEHNGKEVSEDEYLTDALSDQGVRIINESSKNKKPFFLMMSYNAPHTPLEAKKEDMEVFASIKNKDRRTYAAMVYAVDRGVGKIVEQLKANGQYENTLIVFLSDNGGRPDQGANNYPLKEGKGSTYEGGYRVPMFFHWPGVVPQGKTFEHPVSALDFYPTFISLAGGQVPQGKLLDGKNIWNNFLQNKDSYKDDYIYALRHNNGFSNVGIRNGDWKAVKAGKQPWKLFNITNDISEDNNLSATNPDILKKLVTNGEVWSRTHIQPLFWHDEKTGIQWKDDKMPHFEETFSLKQ